MNEQDRHELIERHKREFSHVHIIRFFHAAVAIEYAGPMTDEEQAFSDAAVEKLGDFIWFHGGLSGRKVGDLLLPASETGSDPRGQNTATPDRTTHVYMSQNQKEASKFARWAEGDLYSIDPIGVIEIDPTWLRLAMVMCVRGGGLLWQPKNHHLACDHWRCDRAEVVGIE
tara:strand:- start:3027 stop:3539 length:513 start_codon:yes stop_codon:yes gene_type:complete